MIQGMDVWGKLWDIANTGVEPGKIEIDQSDCGKVTIVWHDESRSVLQWYDGDWQFSDAVDEARR